MSGDDRCATARFVLILLLPWAAGAAVASETPPGWEVSSEGPAPYEVRLDEQKPLDGRFSATIGCGSCAPDNPATLMQTILADRYRGQRVRLAGHLRTAGVERWAGFWMRVDAADRRAVSFDNMSTRAIRGTTPWTRHEVVLDVPEDAVQIAFGFLLAGNGQVWADDLSLTTVAATVPSTNLRDSPDYGRVEVEEGLSTEPTNLDFEQHD